MADNGNGYRFQSDRGGNVMSLHIDIKTAWCLIAAVVSGAVWTSWQLWDLKQSIKDGTGDRWKKSEMREWSNRLSRENDKLKIPSVDQVSRDLE